MLTQSLKPIELKERTCKQGHYGKIVKIVPKLHMLGPVEAAKPYFQLICYLIFIKVASVESIFGHQV